MDCRIGKMKKVKKKVKMILKDLREGIEGVIETLVFIILLAFGVFISLKILLSLKDSPDFSRFIPFFASVFSIFFTIFPSIYVDRVKSRRKIRKLKSAILLELRYILVSLIENFTRFYEVYFTVLIFFRFDLNWFYELTEKYREYFPGYLMNEIKIRMAIYKNLEDMQHYFEKERSGDRENKPSINPIHMEILSSTLNKLSALDKDFVENILYIRHEINKLNKEIEVLEGLSRTDPILICSIAQRIERIAIKIDKILEKEGANL